MFPQVVHLGNVALKRKTKINMENNRDQGQCCPKATKKDEPREQQRSRAMCPEAKYKDEQREQRSRAICPEVKDKHEHGEQQSSRAILP